MKDMARSKTAIFKTFSEGINQKHPKVFNIFLILALIFLVIAGAFLLSDIMSFKSNAAQKGPLSSLYQKIPNESQATIKNWQERGINLKDQLKSILGLERSAKAANKDPANRDKTRALLAKQRLAKAKEARTITEDPSDPQNPVVFSNLSRNRTTVQPLKATSAIIIGSAGSDGSSGSSDTPVYGREDSYPKDIENNYKIGAAISNTGENQIHSNESVIDDPVTNKSGMNESGFNESVVNESQIRQSNTNQSHMYTKLSRITSKRLPATNQRSNGTRNNSSHPAVPRNTNLSFDNHSSGLVAHPESQMKFAASNTTGIQNSVQRDRKGSIASVAAEFNDTNLEISNQNETSNLKTNNDSIKDKKGKNESKFTTLDQKNNRSSDALGSSSNGIPPNSVPDRRSNITSGQIIRSLEGKSNSPPTGKPFVANNSTYQFQEPKQTYIQNETKPRLDESSTSLLQQPNNSTEGLQNHTGNNNTGKNKKKVSTSSALAKSQQSEIGQTNSASRFRTLKVPTPSWKTKP